MTTEVCRIVEPCQLDVPAGQIRFLFLAGRDLFAHRAERFRLLSRGHPLGEYLAFSAYLQMRNKRSSTNSPQCLCPVPMSRRYAVSIACRCWTLSPGPETRHGGGR